MKKYFEEKGHAILIWSIASGPFECVLTLLTSNVLSFEVKMIVWGTPKTSVSKFLSWGKGLKIVQNIGC
jgi:hypothetical protein